MLLFIILFIVVVVMMGAVYFVDDEDEKLAEEIEKYDAVISQQTQEVDHFEAVLEIEMVAIKEERLETIRKRLVPKVLPS